MIISYYGDGKGKTTAALGLALRASGYEKKILFVQFIKGDFKTGEEVALKRIKHLVHRKFGLGFVGILGDSKPIGDHRIAAQKGLKYVEENIAHFEIIVLDEIFGAVKGGLLELSQVEDLIKKCEGIDLVMTGRPKILPLLERSDLVSEMTPVKHPFEQNVPAKEGIDY